MGAGDADGGGNVTTMQIEGRLSELVRLAKEPPIDDAFWVMGWRAFSEWMDFVWSIRPHTACHTMNEAYGYELFVDFGANPNELRLEVKG